MYNRLSDRIRFVGALTLLLVHMAPGQANGQYAIVKRVTAETDGGIRVTAWTRRQLVPPGNNVVVFYEVANRSNTTIHLVRKPGDLQTFLEGNALVVPFPLPFPEGHGGYDYSFTEVRRGMVHKGQLTIPAARFNKEQTWRININVGYVTDARGLNRQLRPNEDPAPLRGLLGQRILLVALDGLVVRIKAD